LPNLIDSLCLRVTQMPRTLDMAIFVLTDRQNRVLYPLLRMRAGVTRLDTYSIEYSIRSPAGNFRGSRISIKIGVAIFAEIMRTWKSVD
jgi:hypothetical protein